MYNTLFVIGVLFSTFAGVACVPFFCDIFLFAENIAHAFLIFIAFSLFLGVALMLATYRNIKNTFETKNTFILTILIWMIIPFITSIPLYVWKPQMGVMNACFESVAALTTTGSTLLCMELPKALFLWMCLLQWFGGVGILVIGMTFFPVLKVGGMQLLHREFADPSEKFLPRASGIASFVILTYSLLTIICVVLCALAGMPFYSAFCHALSTLSTGGLTPYNTLNTNTIKIITMIFMILGATPLIFFVYLWHKEWKSLRKNAQVRSYTLVLLSSVFLMVGWSFYHFDTANIIDICFNVISTSTTTGYFEWANCGAFPTFILSILGIVGGCMGSTAGGVKIFRLQILLSTTRMHLRHLSHPNTVFLSRYQGQKIQQDIALTVLSFITLYMISIAFMTSVLSFLGHDLLTSFACTLGSITNSGSGLSHILGWKGTYDDFQNAEKLCLIVGMIMGRLELITLFLLFMPSFWKK